jgi:hypothetical protein
MSAAQKTSKSAIQISSSLFAPRWVTIRYHNLRSCSHKTHTMAKKPRKKTGPKTTYMFSSLHKAVNAEVRGDIGATRFHDQNTDLNSDNVYETRVLARFECINGDCPKSSWISGKVTTRIRGYPGNAYNAVVFSQRCLVCNSLGRMILDTDTYVERVAYRLRKWAGIKMDQRPRVYRKMPPHKKDLCEGCRAGFCEAGGK